MDRSTFIAIILCALGYIGYESYLSNKYPDRFKQQAQVSEQINAINESPASDTAPAKSTPGEMLVPANITLLSKEELTIANEDVIYVFSQKTGQPVSVRLKNYLNEEQTDLLEILAPEKTLASLQNTEAPIKYAATRNGQSISFQSKTADGIFLQSTTYNIDEKGYGAQVEVSWTNITTEPAEFTSKIQFDEIIDYTSKTQHSFMPGVPNARPSLVLGLNGSIKRHDVSEYCNAEDNKSALEKGSYQQIDFIGYDKHYFLNVFLPENKSLSYSMWKGLAEPKARCQLFVETQLGYGMIDAGKSVSENFRWYFGPKSRTILEKHDVRLLQTLDLGFFAKISNFLFTGLEFVYSSVKNWGIAIILFTIFLKILFFPLTRHAAISMNRMKKLQPEMNRIKEKYKDDLEKQRMETMRFMTANKVNPLKGCFPLFLQFPVFIAFYRLLSTSIELRQAPFFGWIKDLSEADPYYVLPLLACFAMFLQQKLTPTTSMDKTQERVMLMMPIIFGVFMLTCPAGLSLYVLVNTLVSIAQQQWLNKKLN